MQFASRHPRRIWAILSLTIVTLFASPAAAKPRDCYYPIRRALVRGGYYFGIDCHEFSSFRLTRLGQMKRGRWRYTAYDLFYSFFTFRGGAEHGDRKLLFFDNKGRYVGMYIPLLMLQQHISLNNSTIYLDGKKGYGYRISLTKHGLPKKILFNGYESELER